MERKIENALESRQEAIKMHFSGLFLPTWGLSDTRKAEMQRAQDELKHAQEVALNKFAGIVEKVQAYLDAATAQLNVAITGKQEAEQLLQQVKNSTGTEGLDIAVQKAKECAKSADEAVNYVNTIARLADELVKVKQAQASQLNLNFGEIDELKKFREIVNVEGEVAEYAQAAKVAALEVDKLASKK
jgi:hypothetical protein